MLGLFVIQTAAEYPDTSNSFSFHTRTPGLMDEYSATDSSLIKWSLAQF